MNDTAILEPNSVETANHPPDDAERLTVPSEQGETASEVDGSPVDSENPVDKKQREYEEQLEYDRIEAEEAAQAKIDQEAALAELHANTPPPEDKPYLKPPGEAPLGLVNRRGRRKDRVDFPSDIAALAILATYRLSDRFTDEHDNEAQRQADGSVRLSIKQRGPEGGHLRVYVRVPDVVELSVVDGPDSTV